MVTDDDLWHRQFEPSAGSHVASLAFYSASIASFPRDYRVLKERADRLRER